MKTLLHKKVNFIVLFLSLSNLAHGAAVVKQIKGNAFMIYDTKTQSLHIGDHVPSNAEILTEEGTELTLSNYYNHQFHITGSSHLKINKRSTLLFEGYLWFRSTSKGKKSAQDFNIKTANGIIQYNDTEGIVSFDPSKIKTQFLGLRGNNIFFNKVSPGPRYEIKPGMFSFIDSNNNNGIPRAPRPLGLKSYKKLTALFDNIRSLPVIPGLVEKTPSRGIASIGDVQSNFKNMLNKQQSYNRELRQTGPAPIKINIYAPKSHNTSPKNSPRVQIKVSKKNTPAKRAPASIVPSDNPFEEALQSRYKDKMRHEKEINSLVDALKSIGKDYQKKH